jgi:hypothetical protein
MLKKRKEIKITMEKITKGGGGGGGSGEFMQRKYTSKNENNKGIIRKGRYKK